MTVPTGPRPMRVDPRLRARRQDIVRQQGRQRLRRVQAVLGVGLVAGVVWGAAMSPLLDVDRVLVRSTDGTRAAEVERAVGIGRGSALATLPLDQITDAAEAVPWVAQAKVSRSWPGTVLISVTDRAPVAGARLDDGRTVLLDEERQLAVLDGPVPEDLVRLVGAVEEVRLGSALDERARQAMALAVLLDGDVRNGLAAVGWSTTPEIMVSDDGSLALILGRDDGGTVEVRIGPSSDLGEKLDALGALLAGDARSQPGDADAVPVTFLGGDVVIDVRVPSAPVVVGGAVS